MPVDLLVLRVWSHTNIKFLEKDRLRRIMLPGKVILPINLFRSMAINDIIRKENKGRRYDLVIAISSDHAGFELRKKIMDHLEAKGHTFLEYGAVSSDTAASYVSAGQGAAEDVASGTADKGIVICGTGIGISMVCN